MSEKDLNIESPALRCGKFDIPIFQAASPPAGTSDTPRDGTVGKGNTSALSVGAPFTSVVNISINKERAKIQDVIFAPDDLLTAEGANSYISRKVITFLTTDLELTKAQRDKLPTQLSKRHWLMTIAPQGNLSGTFKGNIKILILPKGESQYIEKAVPITVNVKRLNIAPEILRLRFNTPGYKLWNFWGWRPPTGYEMTTNLLIDSDEEYRLREETFNLSLTPLVSDDYFRFADSRKILAVKDKVVKMEGSVLPLTFQNPYAFPGKYHGWLTVRTQSDKSVLRIPVEVWVRLTPMEAILTLAFGVGISCAIGYWGRTGRALNQARRRANNILNDTIKVGDALRDNGIQTKNLRDTFLSPLQKTLVRIANDLIGDPNGASMGLPLDDPEYFEAARGKTAAEFFTTAENWIAEFNQKIAKFKQAKKNIEALGHLDGKTDKEKILGDIAEKISGIMLKGDKLDWQEVSQKFDILGNQDAPSILPVKDSIAGAPGKSLLNIIVEKVSSVNSIVQTFTMGNNSRKAKQQKSKIPFLSRKVVCFISWGIFFLGVFTTVTSGYLNLYLANATFGANGWFADLGKLFLWGLTGQAVAFAVTSLVTNLAQAAADTTAPVDSPKDRQRTE